MSKAEELSQNRYPTMAEKYAFIDGYEQAEKDLGLTWEDMLLLADIEQDVFNHSDSPLKGVQAAYEEVLKRFKDFKERKEK